MKKPDTKNYSLEEIHALKSETDWSRLESSEPYEDEQEFEVDWSSAKIGLPEPKKMISLRVDPDVLEFFKSQGKGYQTRINAVLRAYKDAKEGAV